MRIRLFVLAAALFALFFSAGAALAAESCANVASTTGGTTVLSSANNLRNGLLCQNIGASNDVNCSIGGTPVAAQQGYLLKAAGGNMTLAVAPVTTANGSGQSRLPGGAVSCITGSSTSYVCCVSW